MNSRVPHSVKYGKDHRDKILKMLSWGRVRRFWLDSQIADQDEPSNKITKQPRLGPGYWNG